MSELTVEIQDGEITGTLLKNNVGENVYGFMGIPYAEPPVGHLRFKAPLPAKPWQDTKDCTQFGNVCAQYNAAIGTIGSEDCLFLNVFTKDISKSTLKPVLFWIHGGAFTMGSSNEYDPSNILSEDVVLVTINYRLGILGFLSLEDSALGVPGNAGLKDMILALKWVQQNISVFNGDPNNVTIFGGSAGGASVHYLLLSPMSKGLFHKAIAQSGSALNPWTRGRRCATDIARSFNYSSSNEKDILDYLRSLSVEELAKGAASIGDEFTTLSKLRFFGPVIEKPSQEPAFLTRDPLELILSGHFLKVPLIMGYAKDEGMFLEMFEGLFQAVKEPYVTNFENIIPHIPQPKNGNDMKDLAKKIKRFYFGAETPNIENIQKSCDVFGDAAFLYGIYLAVKKQLKRSTSHIFVYRFSFDCLGYSFGPIKFTRSGTSHGGDIMFLFNTFDSGQNKPGSTHEKVVTNFVKLWTNFARTGNPTPSLNDGFVNVAWKPVDNQNFNYIDISDKLFSSTTLPEEERMKFWDNVFGV